VFGQVVDTQLDFGFVTVADAEENGSPDRHVGRSVCGRRGASVHKFMHVGRRELAAIVLCKLCEIGWLNLERSRCGALASAVDSMTGPTVLVEHLFPGRRRRLRRSSFLDLFLLRGGGQNGDKHEYGYQADCSAWIQVFLLANSQHGPGIQKILRVGLERWWGIYPKNRCLGLAGIPPFMGHAAVEVKTVSGL